jgi:glycogen debranching enzyme
MGIEDIRDALVIREHASFLLTDPTGNVPAGNAQGLGVYHADTRHLSAYELKLNGGRPVILLSTAELGYAMEQVMTNPTIDQGGDRIAGRGTIELRRLRVISDIVEETLRITNFNSFPVTLNVMYEFGADFADIFDVRGYDRERSGEHRKPVVGERSIRYSYAGIDGRERTTSLEFDRRPDFIDESTVLFKMTLPRRQSLSLRLEIGIDGHAPKRRATASRRDTIGEDYRRWMESCTAVATDNQFYNRVIDRSLRDVRMLWSETEDGQPYPAAGTPWFDALFGRDSCIMSMQMLAYRPELARSALRLLAKWQGTASDPHRDEEPGKILHELRFDELSQSGELPYTPYYGSIDSTPLFLMLAAEYFAWTNDVRLIRSLLPAIRSAIDWLERYGDALGDGYLSYEKRSAKGLVNQGWKDSWDAVVHADGVLALPPIALAEAQGYAYAARTRLAPALERAGEPGLAERLRRDARKLYRKFNEDFWDAELGFYAMALDGERRRAAVISTNPAHCMWTGLIDPQRAAAVCDRLAAPDAFSGWGLRTISDQHPRYNPLGYHLGTVWPHDNSIATMGMKMYGYEERVNELASALFDAAASFPYFRLPEVFGGEARTAYGPPVPYPVACCPQSWAAGAFPLITQAMLGLKAEAPEGRLRIVNPRLPYWLNRVYVRGLRVGNGNVSLLYRRDGSETRVEVQDATGGLDVVVSSSWPLAL